MLPGGRFPAKVPQQDAVRIHGAGRPRRTVAALLLMSAVFGILML